MTAKPFLTYSGKVCKRHPDLAGERLSSSNTCIQCNKDGSRKWRLKNRERHAESVRQWNKNNPEKKREHSLNGMRTYRSKNREKMLAADRERVAKNPAKSYEKAARYKAARIGATPKWANRFFMQEIYDLAVRRTRVTGLSWHVDHIVPLKSKLVCGLHCEQNLQVISKKTNLEKGNRLWPDMPQ